MSGQRHDAAKWCVGCGAPLVDVRCSNILCRNFDGPSAASSDLLIAVAIAQAQSGTFEQTANEEIPQSIFTRLYAKKCLATADDPSGKSYVYPTERGERLLAWILRRAAA